MMILITILSSALASSSQKLFDEVKAPNPDLTTIRSLVDEGADLNYKPSKSKRKNYPEPSGFGHIEYSETPFNCALERQEEFPELAEYMFETQIKLKGDTVGEILLKHGGLLTDTQRNRIRSEAATPINDCCAEGKIEAVKELLVQRADPNQEHKDPWSENRETPLTAAIMHDHPEIAKLLIEAKADINKETRNWCESTPPAICAVSRKDDEVSASLFRDLIDKNQSDLAWWTYKNINYLSEIKVHQLIEMKVDPNYDPTDPRDDRWIPSLIIQAAAFCPSNIGAVKALLEHKADINVMYGRGRHLSIDQFDHRKDMQDLLRPHLTR